MMHQGAEDLDVPVGIRDADAVPAPYRKHLQEGLQLHHQNAWAALLGECRVVAFGLLANVLFDPALVDAGHAQRPQRWTQGKKRVGGLAAIGYDAGHARRLKDLYDGRTLGREFAFIRRHALLLSFSVLPQMRLRRLVHFFTGGHAPYLWKSI